MNSSTIHPLLREPRIGDISTIIVDQHHDVFEHWMTAAKSRPAVVVHIDSHEGLSPGAPVWSKAIVERDLRGYQEHLHTGNFILPALFYGAVSVVYWHNPSEDRVIPTGHIIRNRVESYCTIEDIEGRMCLHKQETPPRSITQTIAELSKYTGPLILDIDLDAVECYTMRNPQASQETRQQKMRENYHRMCTLIEGIPKPTLITIARSQSPYPCVDPGYLECIEAMILGALERAYKK